MALITRNVLCCHMKPACHTLRMLMTSPVVAMPGGKWRLQQGQDPCGNRYGPLRDIPDWSYADGRPAPLTDLEKYRKEQQKELAERAVRLIQELKYAKEKHKMDAEEKEAIKQKILSKKLKPKAAS